MQMKEIKIPELAESIMEGTIAEWLVKKGEKIEKGDPVVELETDKVNIEVHSEYTGVITDILSSEGDDVEIGDVIAKLDENAEAGSVSPDDELGKEENATKQEEKAEEKAQEEQETVQTQTDTDSREVIASPAARKRARELNI